MSSMWNKKKTKADIRCISKRVDETQTTTTTTWHRPTNSSSNAHTSTQPSRNDDCIEIIECFVFDCWLPCSCLTLSHTREKETRMWKKTLPSLCVLFCSVFGGFFYILLLILPCLLILSSTFCVESLSLSNSCHFSLCNRSVRMIKSF